MRNITHSTPVNKGLERTDSCERWAAQLLPPVVSVVTSSALLWFCRSRLSMPVASKLSRGMIQLCMFSRHTLNAAPKTQCSTESSACWQVSLHTKRRSDSNTAALTETRNSDSIQMLTASKMGLPMPPVITQDSQLRPVPLLLKKASCSSVCLLAAEHAAFGLAFAEAVVAGLVLP